MPALLPAFAFARGSGYNWAVMTDPLYLAYPKRLSLLAEDVSLSLFKRGYANEQLRKEPQDGSLVLFLLDMETTAEEIYRDVPWIEEQFDHSSLKHLRLMPFLIYQSSLGNVEEQVENLLSETLESVFSGEFKPYGYDLDAADPLEEFSSVLEGYEE